MSTLSLRLLSSEEEEAVLKLQAGSYPEFLHEPWSIFEQKIKVYPTGCFVAVIENEVVGYLLSHPWEISSPVPLNDSTFSIPSVRNCYHIHDITVSPHHRGKGIAKELLNQAIKEMKRLELQTMTLVAVGNAHSFWEKCGFVKSDQEKDLSTYPEKVNPVFMTNKML